MLVRIDSQVALGVANVHVDAVLLLKDTSIDNTIQGNGGIALASLNSQEVKRNKFCVRAGALSLIYNSLNVFPHL